MLLVTAPWSTLAAIIVMIYLATHRGAFDKRAAEGQFAEEEPVYVDDGTDAVPVISADLSGAYPAAAAVLDEVPLDTIINEEPFEFDGDFEGLEPEAGLYDTDVLDGPAPVIPDAEPERVFDDPYVAAAVRKGMPEAIYVGGFKYVPVGPSDEN